MRLGVLRPAAILTALVLIASSASAQSLAEIARQEEARRSAVRTAAKAKVLTNADLGAEPKAVDTAAAPSAVAAPAAAAVAAAVSTSPANDSAAAVTAAEPDAKPKEDEAYWRGRAAAHRERLERAQQRIDGFTRGPNADPREQARIDARFKLAQDEFKRADEAQRLLIMQADVAGIPMAWIK